MHSGSPFVTDGLGGVNAKRVWTASVLKNDGVDVFLNGVVEVLNERFGFEIGADVDPAAVPSPAPAVGDIGKHDRLLITQERHRKHLESALVHLESFLDSGRDDVVLGAEDLRYAAREIGRIGGTIDVEDVLDSIFRDFCIGK